MVAYRDTQRALPLRRLRKEIPVGLEQVEKDQVAPLDVEKIKAGGRKRLAARRRKDVG